MTTELAIASTYSAQELCLPVAESITATWREHSRAQMATECSRLVSEVGDRQWLLADAFATIVARAGARPSDRVHSLVEFCGELEVAFDPKYAREFARIAIAVPPEKRAEFRCTFGHFQQLVRGGSREGETPQARVERIYELAAQVDDEGLGVRAAARLARETTHSNGRLMESASEQAAETLVAAESAPAVSGSDLIALVSELEPEGYWDRRAWSLALLLKVQALLSPDFDAEPNLPGYLKRAITVARRLAENE